MANKIRIRRTQQPPPTGTYSQAIRTGDLVFRDCPAGRNDETASCEEAWKAQTRRMLSNVEANPECGRCSPADNRQVYAAARGHKGFQGCGVIYDAALASRLGVTALPTRTAFAAAGLPAGALVMRDVIAAYTGRLTNATRALVFRLEMRITIVIGGLSGGGRRERVCVNLANAWRRVSGKSRFLPFQDRRAPAYALDSRVRRRHIGWKRWADPKELNANIDCAHAAGPPWCCLLRDHLEMPLLALAPLLLFSTATPNVVVAFLDFTNVKVLAAMHETGILLSRANKPT